jgi:DnaJ-class molecular chaperone
MSTSKAHEGLGEPHEIHVRCDRCFGRGYQPEARKSGRGVYLRTCPGCGGAGQRLPPKRQRKSFAHLRK